MNTNKVCHIQELSNDAVALVIIQLFRLLFGGYLIGLDQFHYNDPESAMSVLMIYAIIGILTALFLMGKRRIGLLGLIVLSIILLIMESIYTIVYASEITPDPSWHSPFAIWWATVLNFLFPLLTLGLALKVHKEDNIRKLSSRGGT
jgi:hypothetical protein